jgi:hypothetical protein
MANEPTGRKSVGQLVKSYFFWTYERGSFHYDVMVTLILLFLFLSPHWIDFKDRPVETVALHASEVLVKRPAQRGQAAALSIRFARMRWGAQRPTQSCELRSCGQWNRSRAR